MSLILATLIFPARTSGLPYPTQAIGAAELMHDMSAPLREMAGGVKSTSESRPNTGAFQPGIGSGDLLGPIQNFEGLSNDDNGSEPNDRISPPDPEGDVGPRHYVQWVNTTLAVYNKQGLRLLGPLAGSVVWSGFGLDGAAPAARLCETTNRGDPVVLYDQLADRWVLSQFAWNRSGARRVPPFVQCIAVSASGDPTGRYYRYAFQTPNDLFNDYAKLGMWPNAYVLTYIAASEDVDSEDAGTVVGSGVLALNRSRMLSGLSTDGVYVLAAGAPPLLPADLDGPAELPGDSSRPLGEPILVGLEDDEEDLGDQLEVWRFHVDFPNPTASILSDPALLPTDVFDSYLCADAACVPQRADDPHLEALSDRLMFRAEYRRLAGFDALALTHTVRADRSGRTGVRWYVLRDSGRGLAIEDQGIFAAADKLNRWLPSAALDRLGNLGIGFSAAGPDLFPSIVYTGVPAKPIEPSVAIPGEGRLADGQGAQAQQGRWGDYASVTVDPVDGCSFWFTHEYYPARSPDGWHTRIGSFRFPTCGAVPTIDGDAREGERLSAAPGSWPEFPDATFRYEWRRCDALGESCFDIAGAETPVYRLTAADVDWTLKVVVTAVAPAGVSSSLSRATDVVAPIPATHPIDLAVTIDPSAATARVGERVDFTVRVSNRGDGTATGVRLTIDLPPTLGLASYSADRGPGCALATALVCDLKFVPINPAATVRVSVIVAGRGRLTFSAKVAADQTDPTESSNVDLATILATGPPRLLLLDAPQTERARGTDVVTVMSRVSIDEPAKLALSASTMNGRRLPLLAGSSVAGQTLRETALRVIGRARKAGTIQLRARLRAHSIADTDRFQLHLRATGSDGLASVLTISVEPPPP